MNSDTARFKNIEKKNPACVPSVIDGGNDLFRVRVLQEVPSKTHANDRHSTERKRFLK